MTEPSAVRWVLEWLPGPDRQQYVLKGFDSRSMIVWHELLDRKATGKPGTLSNAVGMLVVAADEFLERHA